MAQIVYVDESGDLGWTFGKPYGQGGSSRYLTIAALLLPDGKDHIPERIVRHLYKTWNWDTGREKKWVDMPEASREAFAKSASKMALAHADIEYRAIVVAKERVQDHLCSDPNKLYNWMLKLLLLDKLALHDHVTLIPDPRSIKVANGKMLDHYLEMALYEKEAATRLVVAPCDSRHCLNLQFVDMLAGLVQASFEFGKSANWDLLRHQVYLKRLFFQGE